MTERFVAENQMPGAVSYGPAGADTSAWVLSVSCGDERVEVELPERPMYELWTEVRGVPWPDPSLPGEGSRRRQDRLVRQLVHAATGADEEMLQEALAALGVRKEHER